MARHRIGRIVGGTAAFLLTAGRAAQGAEGPPRVGDFGGPGWHWWAAFGVAAAFALWVLSVIVRARTARRGRRPPRHRAGE